MLIDFIPSVTVSVSLAACVALPAMLLGLSHGPQRVAAPGRRFLIAAALTWAAWLAAMLAVMPNWVDLVSGALLVATATLAGLTLWTLVAWGFTLSMLLALNRAGGSLSAEEWALAYTRGKPLDAFARDRLGVLFALGLAAVRDEEVVMTAGHGWLVARIVGVLRLLFGLPR